MATYGTLADDVRLLVPEFTATEFDDDDVARLLYRAILRLVNEACGVAPNHHLLPQAVDQPAVPANLTTGFTLPTDLLRLRRVELHYDDDTRTFVTIVDEQSRNDRVRPRPAAYIDPDGTLYPIPANGTAKWTDAQLESAGWDDLAASNPVNIEYVQKPTDPGSSGGSSSTGVDTLFEDAALFWAASRIARGLQSGRWQDLLDDYDDAKTELLATVGLGTVANQQKRIREVW